LLLKIVQALFFFFVLNLEIGHAWMEYLKIEDKKKKKSLNDFFKINIEATFVLKVFLYLLCRSYKTEVCFWVTRFGVQAHGLCHVAVAVIASPHYNTGSFCVTHCDVAQSQLEGPKGETITITIWIWNICHIDEILYLSKTWEMTLLSLTLILDFFFLGFLDSR
jgi:hypothetical protein